MERDSPLTGILLMIGFCIVAPLGDALAKMIGNSVPLAQVVLVRFAVQALILWPVVQRHQYPLPRSRALWGWILARTLMQIACIGTMVLALRQMPLAETIAIFFVMPFMMLLLGHLFLHEQVGVHRLAACAVGFVGTLTIMQPTFAEVGWVAVLPVIAALEFAAFMLLTRRIRREIAPLPLQALTGILGTAVLFPLVALADGRGWMELDPVTPGPVQIALLLLLGVAGTVSHLLMTWSLRFAPTTTLAPIQYVEIPVAVGFGWAFFAEFPNRLALAGIGIVLAAGLYIIWREQTVLRQRALQARSAVIPAEE